MQGCPEKRHFPYDVHPDLARTTRTEQRPLDIYYMPSGQMCYLTHCWWE